MNHVAQEYELKVEEQDVSLSTSRSKVEHKRRNGRLSPTNNSASTVFENELDKKTDPKFKSSKTNFPKLELECVGGECRHEVERARSLGITIWVSLFLQCCYVYLKRQSTTITQIENF